jgi:hypothetical protein
MCKIPKVKSLCTINIKEEREGGGKAGRKEGRTDVNYYASGY